MSAADCRRLLDLGIDFAVVGRAAILAKDFPLKVGADFDYQSPPTPVPASLLREQELSPKFVSYMSTSFKGFVEEEAA